MVALIVVLVVAAFVLITLARTIRIVPQARAGVVERLGRYSRTLNAGLAIVVPFVDRIREIIDLREQVVSFQPQPVITEDNRVELKAIDPPSSVQESMEKQMRADRDKRAAILNAEGVKQSQILEAEGEKQSAILRAEGRRQAQILEAEGEAKAIDTVFRAIHDGKPDSELLAYQYVQALPEIANGQANKVWIIPSEFAHALGRLGDALGGGSAPDEK